MNVIYYVHMCVSEPRVVRVHLGMRHHRLDQEATQRAARLAHLRTIEILYSEFTSVPCIVNVPFTASSLQKVTAQL